VRVGLFLGSGPESGGIFQYGLAIFRAVESLKGHGVQCVVAYADPSWANILRRSGIASFELKRNWWRPLLKAWLRFRVPLSPLRAALWVLHPGLRQMVQQDCALWIFPGNDALPYALPVNFLAAVHDLMHRYERHFPEVSSKGRYVFRESHYKALTRAATGVLVDSNVGKRHVCESYAIEPDRVHVLPYLAPDYIYSAAAAPRKRSPYSLPGKYFFYPAQFWQHKNHLTLIRALAQARESCPDMALVLAGAKKNGYDDVAREVERLGLQDAVLFLGYVLDADIPPLYQGARALVMPTCFGPTNIPPLEALVLGCPVAVSNIYGMPEQLGDAALLFDPMSTDGLAQTMVRLWTDDELCAVLIEKGRQHVRRWDTAQFNARFRHILWSALEHT